MQSWFSQMFSPTLPGEEVAMPVGPGSVSSFSPSPLSPSPGQMGAVTYHPSPHHTLQESGMGPEQTPGGVGQARWERAGQSRLNLSLTRHHPQVEEAQSCLRQACSWSMAAPPLGLTN